MRLHVRICLIKRDRSLKASLVMRARQQTHSTTSRAGGNCPRVHFRSAIPADRDVGLTAFSLHEDVWRGGWRACEGIFVCSIGLSADGADGCHVDQVVVSVVFVEDWRMAEVEEDVVVGEWLV